MVYVYLYVKTLSFSQEMKFCGIRQAGIYNVYHGLSVHYLINTHSITQ